MQNVPDSGITRLKKSIQKMARVREIRIKGVPDINSVKDKDKRTMLFTHLGNKCFRTRDVSFGKGFKDRIGMLPEEKPSEATKWKRVRIVTDFEYNLISAYNEQLAIARFRDAMGLQSGEPA